MSFLAARRPLISALLIVAILPIRQAAPGRASGARLAAVAQPIRVAAITPNPLAVSGIRAAADTLLVASTGGVVTFSVAYKGQAIRAVSVAGWISAPASTSLAMRTATGWRPVGVSDDADPLEAGKFTILPVEINSAGATFRLTITPRNRPQTTVMLKDLRVYAVLPLASLCGARACSSLAVNAAAQSAAAARAAVSGYNWGGLDVISRDQWGAPNGEQSPLWIPVFERPYHIIIHHTDQNPGLNGSTADIQTIWSYHTYSLGWGDIGYNYLIDAYGHIYEGRAGGDDVVGAHTERFNYGAVAISLMGDYTSAKPTKAMLAALKRLLVMLSNKYGIDPQSSFTAYDGATYDAIAGHRDFNFTYCPGGNVYNLLPSIRYQVSKSVRSNAALNTGETVYVNSGKPTVAYMVVRNTGTTTWNGRYSIRLTAGTLFDLPTGYSVPDVKPGGSITIPLFLPTLKEGQVINTDWQLADMNGNLVGDSFPFTVLAVAPGAPTPAPQPPPSLTDTPVPTHTTSPTATATGVPTNTALPSKTPKPMKHTH